MTEAFTRPARSLKQALDRQLPKRRDDSGLTTLEWLLIVAAVAGLAALAVVLVQNVVDTTGEQIAGTSARQTAARVAASAVMQEAENANPALTQFNTWAKWDNYFTDKCNRISVTYSDALPAAGATMTAEFAQAVGAANPPTVALLQAAHTGTATAAAPQANCVFPQ